MKKNELTKSVFAALLLVSTVASAEDKYPASDFQPKVVYSDDAATSGASSAPVAPISSTSSSSGDSQYPAANFEPKVVYSDADYKHTDSTPGSAASSSYTSSNAGSSASSSSASQVAKEESSIGYLLGLVVLGVAGFVLFKKGAGLGGAANGSKSSRVAVKAAGGLTGVARYVLKTSGTGVSRYLEKNAKSAGSSAATGVAKYLASHGSSASTGSKAATGVEKYMRNKG